MISFLQSRFKNFVSKYIVLRLHDKTAGIFFYCISWKIAGGKTPQKANNHSKRSHFFLFKTNFLLYFFIYFLFVCSWSFSLGINKCGGFGNHFVNASNFQAGWNKLYDIQNVINSCFSSNSSWFTTVHIIVFYPILIFGEVFMFPWN